MRTFLDDESIVDSSVKAFSEGFDSKRETLDSSSIATTECTPQKTPSARWTATVHTASGILNASRGSQRSTLPEHVFLLKLPVLQEGP